MAIDFYLILMYNAYRMIGMQYTIYKEEPMSKLTSEQRKKRNVALFKPMMATIIAAFLIILGVFLPFTRRNSNRPENFDEYLEQYMEYYNVDSLEPDELHLLQEHYDEKFNKTSLWSDYRVMAPDLLHILISKFNFINFIGFILFTVQYLSPAILAAVMIICALCKKPTAVIVFDVLAFLLYLSPARIIKHQPVGIGFFLIFIAIALVAAAAIWFRKAKKNFDWNLKIDMIEEKMRQDANEVNN